MWFIKLDNLIQSNSSPRVVELYYVILKFNLISLVTLYKIYKLNKSSDKLCLFFF